MWHNTIQHKKWYKDAEQKQKQYNMMFEKGHSQLNYYEKSRVKAHYFLRQDGKCAICDMPIGQSPGDLDHNHKTDRVRGLLCRKCNILLGMAKSDEYGIDILVSAISYLRDTDNIK